MLTASPIQQKKKYKRLIPLYCFTRENLIQITSTWSAFDNQKKTKKKGQPPFIYVTNCTLDEK